MKFIKWLGIVILLLIVVAGGYVWLSIRAMKSADAEVRDLGIVYTAADATRAIKDKAGVELDNISGLYLGSNPATEGSKAVDTVFSNAEVSSAGNYANAAKGPFKNVQVKMLGGNAGEASGFLMVKQLNAPVYVKGTVTVSGPKAFTVKASELKVGNYNVPPIIIKQVESRFNSYLNGQLNKVNGLEIERVDINTGQVHFVGKVPSKVTAGK
jgi:hypothetical protein